MSDKQENQMESPSESTDVGGGDVIHYELPPNVVHDGVGDLAEFISSNPGRPITLDGSCVRQIGAQGAQLLSMAAKAWAEEKADFTVCDPSGAIRDCLDQLGMNASIEILDKKDIES